MNDELQKDVPAPPTEAATNRAKEKAEIRAKVRADNRAEIIASRGLRRLQDKLHAARRMEQRVLAQIATVRQANSPQELWAKNLAQLPDVERGKLVARLEAQQAITAELAGVMMSCIRDLDAGRLPGPGEKDTYWVDNVFVEALEHQKATHTLNKIVWHPSAEEFSRLYRDSNIFELFAAADSKWYQYGYITVLPTWLWEKFLQTVVRFFRSNCDYVASDGEGLAFRPKDGSAKISALSSAASIRVLPSGLGLSEELVETAAASATMTRQTEERNRANRFMFDLQNVYAKNFHTEYTTRSVPSPVKSASRNVGMAGFPVSDKRVSQALETG
jgi:hypothetical protein